MKRTKILFGVMLLTFISIFVYNSYAQNAQIERLRTDLKYLADDKLEGRLPGTAGNTAAANYIMEEFKKCGLKAFDFGYLQQFKFNIGTEPTANNDMYFNTLLPRVGLPKEDWKKIKRSWKMNEDYRPLSISDNGKVENAEIVFAGFGVTSQDLNYDDYKGIDVKGKAVIVIADSMSNGGSKYNFLDDYSNIRYKVMNAREHGAAAVILVKRQSDSANTYYKDYLNSYFSKAGIIVIQANRTAIAKFFPKDKNLYPMEKAINDNKVANSFLLPDVTVTINTEIETKTIDIPNVAGYIEGSSKPNEYIVVGAHFDHLGWGDENSIYRGKTKMIHNGADDNASGVSAVLELARNLSANKPERSVIFVAFNAEEKGLLGSAYFANNPPVPANQIVAMINFDMVGRLKDRSISVLGTGTSNLLTKYLDEAALSDSLNISKMKEGFAPSDQSSFYTKDIPVLMLFTGTHSDYHTPFDDVEKINFDGLTLITNTAEKLLTLIANGNEKPDFNKTIEYEQGEEKPKMSMGSGAWFGIVPDFADEPRGAKISGASDGSPAKKAGLTNGDIITEFAGKTIKNLYDLTYTLKDSKPGDKVLVKYIRNDKEYSVEVTLIKR